MAAPIGKDGHNAPAFRQTAPDLLQTDTGQRAEKHLGKIRQNDQVNSTGVCTELALIQSRAEHQTGQHDVDHGRCHTGPALRQIHPPQHLRSYQQCDNTADQSGWQKQLLQRLDQLTQGKTDQQEYQKNCKVVYDS